MPSDSRTETTAFDLSPPTEGEFNALAAELGEEERKVLLEHGTEAPSRHELNS